MRLLLIETCGSEASIALADTELVAPIVTLMSIPGRTASERLVGHVREAMAAQQWLLRDLSAIAVVRGPGSFTGVRVGLSAAKGFSEAASVPLVGVSRLALLAAAGRLGGRPTDHGDSEVCAILDAGRGEFYCGRYTGYPGSGLRCMSELLLMHEQVVEFARGAASVVVCEPKVQQALAQSLPPGLVSIVPEPTAAAILPLVRQRLLDRAFDDAAELDANYLRITFTSSGQQNGSEPASQSESKASVGAAQSLSAATAKSPGTT